MSIVLAVEDSTVNVDLRLKQAAPAPAPVALALPSRVERFQIVLVQPYFQHRFLGYRY